jgi:hypothetical protein
VVGACRLPGAARPQNQVLENRLASARGEQAAVMASQNGVTELRSETLRARLEHADLPTLAGRSTGNRPCSGPQPDSCGTAVVVVKTGRCRPSIRRAEVLGLPLLEG